MNTITQEYDPSIQMGKIIEHPDNPRRGDEEAVRQSIDRNDFFGAILVQRSTGYIIAGNTRYRVLRSEGAKTIPGFWIDCDDETALRILLADNRTSDLAFYDDKELFDLLQQLIDSEGLEGTGYDRAAYELLLQSIEADAIVGGVRQGLAADDRIDAYNELDIRSIVLPYEAETYERVAEMFSKVRYATGLETNADVVMKLLTEALESLVVDAT